MSVGGTVALILFVAAVVTGFGLVPLFVYIAERRGRD